MTSVSLPESASAPPSRARKRIDGWTAFTFIIAALIALPILVVLAYVFVPSGGIWQHLASTVLPGYVSTSLWLMVGVGVGATVIGVSTAWLVTLCEFPGRRVFEWALLLPLAIPAYVIAYTYTGLFDFAGPVQSALRDLTGWGRADYWFPDVRSLPGAIAMLTLVLYPYVYLLSRAAFLEQSVCVLEVSRTLGCGPWRCFFAVALPLARPAVVAGVTLVLMETLNDFGTVQYFGVNSFTAGIYRTWMGMGEPAAAAQLAAVLTLFIAVLVLLERLSRGRGKVHHTTSKYRQLPRYRLRGLHAAFAFLAAGLPVLFGFIAPAAVLAGWAVETGPRIVDERFFAEMSNSFVLASLAAVLAVVIAMVMAYGLRLRHSPATTYAARIAAMGYGVPGAVIAVGVLIPLAQIDTWINDVTVAQWDVRVGLVLSGSIVAVLFAYMVRFLAVSFNAIEASLGKVTRHMDDAARTLGQKPLGALLRVHLPITKGSLLTAAILVFVDVMKELPATLLLRPFNFDTLAIRAYQLASDERLADAAAPSLAIVLVGIVPVVMLSLAIAKSRPGYEASRQERIAAAVMDKSPLEKA
ncbi:MAG: ABC transporter permease [Alphaproteobacteria bacterium]